MPTKKSQIGKALLAEMFLGTAAGVGVSSRTVIQAVCLNCGCRWLPGTSQEQYLRGLSGQLGQDAKKAAEARALNGDFGYEETYAAERRALAGELWEDARQKVEQRIRERSVRDADRDRRLL